MYTMNDITLYDLMAEDLGVRITKNKRFGYDLQIDNENGVTIVNEQGVHPCAIESYVDMCRRFVCFYDKIESEGDKEFKKLKDAA